MCLSHVPLTTKCAAQLTLHLTTISNLTLKEGHSHISVDNIKMDLKCDGVDWIHMVLDKVQWRPIVNTVTNLGVTKR
jgi:hypothetical protein